MNLVVVTGTVNLPYDVTLTRGNYVNAKFVTNLGRAIIEKLSVRIHGQEIQNLSSYGEYWGVRGMCLTKAQRTICLDSNRVVMI